MFQADYIFLIACWRSSSCSQIESNLFATAWEDAQHNDKNFHRFFGFFFVCFATNKPRQQDLSIYFWKHVQDLHHAVKYRAIYLRQHEEDPQHNDKNFHDCFGVFVCVFARNEDENQKHLFIEVSTRCEAHKFSVHCGPYKRIICWRNSDYVIQIALTPYKIKLNSDDFSV